MNHDSQHLKALFEVWDAVLKHRRRFVWWAFLGAALVLVLSLALPKKYKAKATFERRVDLVMSQMITRGAPESQPNPKKTLAQEIAGQPAVDDLVEKLSAAGHLPVSVVGSDADIEALRTTLARRIVLSHDIASAQVNRVSLEFVDQDGGFARRVVNGLVRDYLARSRAEIEGRLSETAAFYAQELEKIRVQIEELEDQRLAFEVEHAQMLPGSPNDVQALLGAALQKSTEIQQECQAAALRVQSLEQQIAQTPRERPVMVTAANPKRVEIEQQLTQLDEELRTLRGKLMMTQKHPELVSLVQQIEALTVQLTQTPQEVVIEKHLTENPLRQTLEMQHSDAQALAVSLDAKAQVLDQEVQRLLAQSAQVLPVRGLYRKLMRDIDQARRELDFWEDNLRRVRLALTAETGNRGVRLEFLKPCPQLNKPVSPRLLHVLVVAVGVGLLAGGVGVYHAWCRDDSFPDAQRLSQQLGLAVLGSVGELVSAHERVMRWLRAALVYPAQAATMSVVVAVLAGLLYLNLERPQLWQTLMRDPAGFFHDRLPQTPTPDPHPGKE